MPFTSFLLLIFLVEFYYFSRNKTLWTLAPRTLEPRSTQAECIGEHVCWLAADRIESAVTGHLSPDNCPFPKLLGLDRQTSSRGQVIESRTSDRPEITSLSTKGVEVSSGLYAPCQLDAHYIFGRSSWVMLAITVSTVIACMHLKHYSCRNWPTVFCVLLLGHSRPPIMGLATRRLRWRERARTENVFRRRRKVDRDGCNTDRRTGMPGHRQFDGRRDWCPRGRCARGTNILHSESAVGLSAAATTKTRRRGRTLR